MPGRVCLLFVVDEVGEVGMMDRGSGGGGGGGGGWWGFRGYCVLAVLMGGGLIAVVRERVVYSVDVL